MNPVRTCGVVLVASLLLLASTASAAPLNSTTIVSAPDGGSSILAAPGHAVLGYGRTVSGDGNLVLLAGDGAAGGPATSGLPSDGTYAFVRDRGAGTTTLVSRADGQGGAPVPVLQASLSPNGDWVAFTSTSSNVLAGVASEAGEAHMYVRQRSTGKTFLVDTTTTGTPSLGGAYDPSVTVVGGQVRVAFEASTPNLVAGVSGANYQIYVRSIDAPTGIGTTALVSAQSGSTTTGGNAASLDPAISGNGEYVAYDSSATDLVGTTFTTHVYRRRLSDAQTLLVSQSFQSQVGNDKSQYPSISDDGTRIAFQSDASNLEPTVNDDNGETDVLLWDGSGGATVIFISRAGSGVVGDGPSEQPILSPDGNALAFQSTAKNLAPGTAGEPASIRHILLSSTGAFSVLDRLDGLAGALGDGQAGSGSRPDAIAGLSADASFAVFRGDIPNLDAAFSAAADDGQTFGRTVATGRTEPISSAASAPAGLGDSQVRMGGGSVSTGGRYVVFTGDAGGLAGPIPRQSAQAFRRDTVTGATTIVSRADGPSGALADDEVQAATISADGRYVAFVTDSPSLGGSGANADAFVRDTATGQTTRLTTNAGTEDVQISGDGSHVLVLTSTALDVAADTNNRRDAYVIPAGGGTAVLASRRTGASGALSTDNADTAAIDSSGGRVIFTTTADDLGTPNPDGFTHVYVRDLPSATTTLVDRRNGATGAAANQSSAFATISGDGTKVAFATYATNLANDSTGNAYELWIRNLDAATTTRTVRGDNLQTLFLPQFDETGAHLAFMASPDFGSEGSPSLPQLYVQDVSSGVITLASRGDGAGGPASNGPSQGSGLSPDGACLVFNSRADNLSGAQPAGQGYTRVWMRAVTDGCPASPPGGGGDGGGGGGDGGLGGGGLGGGGAGAGDGLTPPVIGPVLSALKLSVRSFAPSTASTALTAKAAATATATAAKAKKKAKKKPKKVAPKTTISYRLSKAATVKLTFLLTLSGKRKGASCVAPSKKLKKAKPCTRTKSVGMLTRTSKAGLNTVPFSGRLGSRALKPGKYVLSAVAKDAAGRSSKAVTAKLTITKAKRKASKRK